MQIGNIGGKPYWSWYGFDSRVEWCACFVSWCAEQCGHIENGVVPKYAGCEKGMRWFKDRGQWADNSIEPAPGMIIFLTGIIRMDLPDHRTAFLIILVSSKMLKTDGFTQLKETAETAVESVNTALVIIGFLDMVSQHIKICSCIGLYKVRYGSFFLMLKMSLIIDNIKLFI